MESKILREILVKSEEETDPRYGCDPKRREIKEYLGYGVVNLDKPSGPTSHQVSSWVSKILHLKRAGHSGTLDPRVTGVFPVTLENATKIVQALLLSTKGYVCLMSLHDDVSDDKLKESCSYFQGEIFQTPPVKSSVKRVLRKRNIYQLELLERENRWVLFNVRCEAGTYIRKLCHDMGLILGVGAHMHGLRRTKAGPFNEDALVTLHDLKDAYEFYIEDDDESYLRGCIQPVEEAVQHLKKIWVKDSAVSAVCHGANLNAPGVSKLEEGIQSNELITLFTLKNELVALGRSLKTSEEIHEMKRGAVFDLKRVIMKQEVYPKRWSKSGDI